MNDVPTILIGLGGIGSRTVDTVYSWLPENKRSHVAVHAFDTNVNDIEKLENLKRDGGVTQTSTNWTVGEYLEEAHESVKDWFPMEHTELMRKSLTDGAGQIRAVSRLAYRAAMQDGKLEGLKHSISHIFKETGKSTSSSARVMIVCSVVGGTGAGIFLQTAMYIRELLETEFKRKNVLIRGAFMLPDILVLTNAITGDEVANIRANAYACVKELNAITKNASVNREDEIDVAIELEYKPNQMDSAGRLNHVITTQNLPYNFCFLFDFENTEKNNLMYLGNYFKQVARSTYLDLFSPISGDRFSKQDNQILTIISKQGLNRYCGAGVSSLIYPYDDIVNYCALKWSTDSLSNEWLKIDIEYNALYRQYEQDIQNGIPREKPEIKEYFRKILDNYAKDERPQPFFKSIFKQLHTIGEKGEIGESKSLLFAQAVEDEIERIIDNDDELQELRGQCVIDENRLKDKDRARNEINNMEESLYDYEKYIKKFVQDTKVYLSNQIVLSDHDHPKYMAGQEYRLNTWLLGKQEPVHPVAVRYMMYHIQVALEDKLMELEPANAMLEKSIKKFEEAYDLPESEDYVETADDRIRLAAKQNIMGKLLNNKFKDFTNEYYDKSYKHLNNLNKFRTNKLRELVFTELLKSIKEMLEDWQRYFKNLEETSKSLLNELELRSTEHEKESDPSSIYVLASKAIKEKMWDNIRMNYSRDELPKEIGYQIYAGQYERFCKKRKDQYITEQKASRIEEMFRKDVVEYCKTQLLKEDGLNINCVRALRKEAEFNAVAEDEINKYIENKVGTLENLARPLVPGGKDANEINAWGVNPDCIKELSGTAVNEMFDGSDLVEDEAFSPYEIIRNRTIYGLTIDDFPKFFHGNNIQPQGAYYEAYNKRIQDLTTKGNTVTPHLDKRWHLPAYLPEISTKRAAEDREKITRSLVLGIMMGYLENTDNHGMKTWIFSEQQGSRLVYRTGNEPTDEYIHTLHDALLHNPVIVDKILGNYERDLQEDTREYRDKIAKHRFYKHSLELRYFPVRKGNINALDLMLRYLDGEPGNEKLMDNAQDALKQLLNEVDVYFVNVFGHHRKVEAKKEAIKFVDKLLADSKKYQSADTNSMLFKNWSNSIDAFKKAKN